MTQVRKILLVQPNLKWMDWNWKTSWDIHPLNLCLLASVVREEYEVAILDANLEDMDEEQFAKALREHAPDMVGVTLLTNEYWEVAHICARMLREIDPSIITVMGGVYATVSYRKIHEDTNFDYICVGEGEHVFPELLNYLNGKGEFPEYGFLGHKEGEVTDPRKVKRAPFIQDLDALKFPAWDLVDYDRYINQVGKVTVDAPYNYPYARIMTSRGCPIGCTFCEVELISGGPFRYRSVDSIIDELKWLKSEYGIKSFMIDDDNFFINRRRVRDFCTRLIEDGLDLQWKAIAVAVFHLTDEVVEMMAAAGCRSVNLAIESGSERVLKDVIRKPVKLEKARHISAKIKSLDMDLICNFIIGLPTETWSEIRETFSFAEELDADYSKFFIATALEGTKLADMVEANNLQMDGDRSGQMKDLNWSISRVKSAEWTTEDITILRAYEWERINFRTQAKRDKLTRMMNISVEDLDGLRRNTFRSVKDNLSLIWSEEAAVEARAEPPHHGDHRSPGATSYPGIKPGSVELAKKSADLAL